MEPTTHPATAHALGCGMNNGRPVIACICGLPNKSLGVPATLGAGEAANSPAFRAIKIPPMPDIHRLKMAVAESGLGRNEMDALESYAQSCARIAQEQADRADAAEASIKNLKGAMMADDDRLTAAANRVNLYSGCDTPDAMADEILALRARLAAVPALPPEDAPSGWAAWLEDQAAMCDPYIQGPKMRRLAAWLAALAAWEGEK